MSVVYLDYAATTPVEPRVIELMCTSLAEVYGNAASVGHEYGLAAERAVERAREQVAGTLNAEARDIIFTSGATEANNLAILGAARFRADLGRHIVMGATEHKAVSDACHALEFSGFEVSRVMPDAAGRIDPDAVSAALRSDTVLVTVMHANNETGVVHDIAAIGERARAHGAVMHVDAAQTVGKLALDVSALDVDLVALSAHKNHGPKGAGALWVRRRPRVRLWPLMYGGGHERGLRAGTLPTHQLVGMGEALAFAMARRDADREHERQLGDRLRTRLAGVEAWHENGAAARRLPGICNIAFAGVDGSSLAAALSADVAVSTGSACTTGSLEPSHVLRAMGQDAATAAGAIRLSWGRHTTRDEIDRAAAAIQQTVERLRGALPETAVRHVGKV